MLTSRIRVKIPKAIGLRRLPILPVGKPWFGARTVKIFLLQAHIQKKLSGSHRQIPRPSRATRRIQTRQDALVIVRVDLGRAHNLPDIIRAGRDFRLSFGARHRRHAENGQHACHGKDDGQFSQRKTAAA